MLPWLHSFPRYHDVQLRQLYTLWYSRGCSSGVCKDWIVAGEEQRSGHERFTAQTQVNYEGVVIDQVTGVPASDWLTQFVNYK